MSTLLDIWNISIEEINLLVNNEDIDDIDKYLIVLHARENLLNSFERQIVTSRQFNDVARESDFLTHENQLPYILYKLGQLNHNIPLSPTIYISDYNQNRVGEYTHYIERIRDQFVNDERILNAQN